MKIGTPVKKTVPILKRDVGKTPTSIEKASDNTRRYTESIPEFKKRRNDFRAEQVKKRDSLKTLKK